MPEHIVEPCYECGDPTVKLRTRRGNYVAVSPVVARGCKEYDANMPSHWDSCKGYKKSTGRFVHPMAKTIPDVNIKYGYTCPKCGSPDCYSHSPYQFASRE